MEVILAAIRAGHFCVENDGSIWRLKVRNRLNVTKPVVPKRAEHRRKNGYLSIKMEVSGKQHWAYAHRIVWTVLMGPIPDGKQINHIDGHKDNNHPSNLELVTPSENTLHAYKLGLKTRPSSIPEPKLDLIKLQAKALRMKGLTFEKIAERLGVSQTLAFRAARYQLPPSLRDITATAGNGLTAASP